MRTTCLVLLTLLAVASAGPASVKRRDSYGSFDSCALTCKQQPTKFSYKEATTYVYDYQVDTETSMAGASEDSAKLSIQAVAEIQSANDCEFALSLKTVRVSHTDAYTGQLRPADREDDFQRVLQNFNLRFSFDDGVISSVCPEDGETTWALNFKRGLLTAFQNSMESLDKNHKISEVDVTGECEAEFTVTSSWGWKKATRVTKTKNLLACSKRDGYKSMFQTVPYKVNSEIQSLPILKGSHKCDYVISSEKILESAVCEETHVYLPFSNHESGGKTRVQQKLTLKSQKAIIDAITGTVKERYSLLFDHDAAQQQIPDGPESLEQKLKEICDQTFDDIRPETPRLYSELVQIIKVLSKSDIERAYKMVKDKVICPKNIRTLKLFMDALPMAETEGAVSLMTTLINSKQVANGDQEMGWLGSLTLIQEPTSSMIEDGLKLLQGPSSRLALLYVSAMVNKYCKTVSDCASDYYIGQIVRVLKDKIPSYCSVDDKSLKDVLMTLRAIGNIGLSSLSSTLDMCVSSDSPLEVKVAAADAYRRMPCDTTFSQRDGALWKVLQDTSQDHEVRITSYLSVMRCPDDGTLSQISQLLDTETDEHLGGFIYSHLSSLKKTSDPLKQDLAKAISLYSFKKFDQNLLKYSSNHEASVLINRLNLGFTADSNIIMNTKSPLPRSAMLNLTVDLFGSSVNLLEVGGRVEGLEILLEKLLGPSGYFPSKAGNLGDDKLNDVRASFYTRVFGNEIFYGHIKGTQVLRGPAKMPNILDILISLANRQAVAYTCSEQLMNVALVVPTVAGLPLEISVNGSLSLDLKAEGKADLRGVTTSPRSMEIDGEFKPSAALEITGTMAVSALTTRMGLRMRNTMHSSTWLKGHIEIDRGHILNIEIEPPGDKMEIFNAKSQFFIIHNDIEKEQDMIKDNYQEYKLCSGDKVATVLGVELCGELKFPNASTHTNSPYFPLTGPSSVSIMTYRRDTHTSYKFLAKRKESKVSSSAEFMMDTPNSKINRLISTDVTIRYSPDKQIDVSLLSPWTKVNLNSALVSNKDILSFVGTILLNDKDKYALTTEVKISRTGSNVAYTPFIELTQGGHTDTLLSGLVNVDLPNKVDANLELKTIGMLPYTVEGGLINQDKEKRVYYTLGKQGKSMYELNVETTIDKNGKDNRNVKIEPKLVVKTSDQTLISVIGSSDYKQDRSAIGDITVEIYQMKPASATWKIIKSKQTNYNIDLKMKSTLLTGAISGDVGRQKQVTSSKLKVTYNIPRIGTDVITWNTKLNDRSKSTFVKYLLTSNLDMKKYSDYNLGLTVKLDHKKQTDVDVELKYGPNPKDKKKMVTLKSSLNRENMSWKNADIGFELSTQAPEKNVDFNIKMDHMHSPTKLDCNVNLKFTPYLKDIVDAGVSLQDNSNKLMNYAGQANLGIMGKKFVINSDLTQKSAKHFQHVLGIEDFNGGSHSVKTAYTIPSSSAHEVTSDININGYKPVLLQGKTVLDPMNFQASGSAVYGRDLYNVSTQTKLTDALKKLNFGLAYPDRQVEAGIEVKSLKDKVSGSLAVDWDVSKNSKSKVSVDGSYRNSVSWDSRVVSGTVNVKTPFARVEDLSADASYSSDSSQYSTKGKLSWGGKQETLSSSLVVKRPLSLQNAEITFMASTPIRQYREVELEINHKLEPTFVSSVKGKLENNKAELLVKGENRGDSYRRDFYGLMEVKTPFAVLRDASVSLEHKDNGRTFKTVGSLGHNNRRFGADLQMDHASNSDGTVNNGNLKLSWPEDVLQTTWQHRNQGTKQITCTLESSWSNNQRVSVNLIGSNNMKADTRYIVGTVNVQTPWRTSRDIIVNFNTTLGTNKFESTAKVLNNRMEKVVYNILLERGDGVGSALYLLKSPLYDQKIHGQTSINWKSYPVTTSAWLEWAPWARIDFDGSLNAASIDDMELNTKLTTPFKNFENIIAGASHKLENAEYVSHARVSYGVRKMIEFENRLRYDDSVKLLRTKLTSPCPYLKSFNTGIRLNTNPYKFEGSADFELLPLVMKYDGLATWNYDPNNWNGKLRVNTPLRQLPYFQIVSWSKKNEDSLRASHIEIEPSSYSVYSLDTSYRVQLPYQLDINLKTPHPDFDALGLTALYSPSESGLQSRFRVNYQPNKDIDSQLKLDWTKNFEGSFLVNTPFKGYENNKILARHDSSPRGFSCHGEASVGGKDVQGDVVFTTSQSAVSGSASLTSPVSGYEKLSGNFNIKGALNKMKADASLNIGSDSLSTTFTNSFTRGFLRSSVELHTPYTQDLKLSVQHKDDSSLSETKFGCNFDGQYGDKSADGKVSVSYAGLKKSKVDLSLNTPFKSAQISLENTLTSDNISGKGAIQTDVYSVGNVEVSYDKSGPLENMVGTISLTRNGESLVDTLVETSIPGDGLHGKIVTKGRWLPGFNAEMDHKGSISDFATKTRLTDSHSNVFDSEITFKMEDLQVDFRSQLNVKYDPMYGTYIISMHKEGTLADLKVDLSRNFNGKEMTAAVVFQSENQIKGLILVNNLSSKYDKVGVEFEHSGDLEKFLSTGKIHLSSNDAITGKVNFYKYNLQRIEASAELSTPWQGYRYSRIEYRHEGGDNRLSCSMNLEYGHAQKISSDLITQYSPSAPSLSFNLKTPFTGYEEIILSGDFDSSKANGKAVLGKGMEFTLSGVHDPSIYPYYIQYQITTPLEVLKKVTLNLKGVPLDGSADLVVFSVSKKIEVNGALQYSNPYTLSLSTQFNSDIQGYRQLQLNIRNEDDALKGKTSHLLVSWDPTQQVVVDGRYFSSGNTRWSSKQERVFELDVTTPFENYKSITMDLEHSVESYSLQTVLSLGVNQNKLIDLDVNYDYSSKYEYSAAIRKPWPMEYTTSYQSDDYIKEGEVYVNWDRDDPSSNLRIKSSWQNQPSNNNKAVGLTYISPARTLGVEHSLSSSADKYSSSGKLFWDLDNDKQVSYSLDISSNNRRKDTAYSGDFKLGLPSRTFGISGSLSNNELVKTADAAFSWDLGKDDSKRMEIQASFSGQGYTKADISLKLPSQDLQVNSALILNQGNTLLDGKTDISYSKEARKTLTLFSKLKNTPSTSSYFSSSVNSFNYSVELGVSHPETKVDVKVDSHVASSDDFLTSSLGVRYMTVRRQMKNLALFAEIDKLRRQISLVASGPSSNAGVSGTVVSSEPLSLMLLGTLDGQEKFRSTLDVNRESKSVLFEIGQSDNLLSLKSYYPNSSAIQSELFHKKNSNDKQEAVIGLRLLNPHLLHSRIQWRPAAVDELKKFVAEQIVTASQTTYKSLQQVNFDLRTELTGKYEEITASMLEDMKPLLKYVGKELETFATDFDNAKQSLNEMYKNNEFFLADISTAARRNADYLAEMYTTVQDNIQLAIGLYRDTYKNLILTVLEKLQQIQQYPFSDSYNQAVTRGLRDFMRALDGRILNYIKYLLEKDMKILERTKSVLSSMENLYSHPRLDFMRQRIEQLKDLDYIHYINKLNNAARNSVDLQRYKDLLYSVKDAGIRKIIPEGVRDMAERTTNEVYQQAQLAYKYWDIEENLSKHLQTSVELLKDIVEDEVREYINLLLIRSPITVFDPENGLIEANFVLPIGIKYLDQMPDLAPYVQQVSETYNKYAPDMDTLYQYYPNIWSSNRTDDVSDDMDIDDDVIASLDEYKPEKSLMDRYLYQS